MAENKKSFVMYADYIHTFESLDDNEAGELIKHILRYVNDLNPESSSKLISIAFEPIKQQFKRDLIRWDSIKEKRSKAGKTSAEKRAQNLTHSTRVENVEQTTTISTVNVNENVNVNVNENVSINKNKIGQNVLFEISETIKDENKAKKGKNKRFKDVSTSVASKLSIDEQNALKIDEISVSETWLNQICIHYSIDMLKLRLFLGDFLTLQRLKDEIHNRSIKDIKKHFISWLKIELTKTDKNGKQPTKTASTIDAITKIIDSRGIRNQ